MRCACVMCVYESVVFEPFRHCHSYCEGDEQGAALCERDENQLEHLYYHCVKEHFARGDFLTLLQFCAYSYCGVLFDTQNHHHLSFRTARKSNINGTTCVTYLIVHTLLSLIRRVCRVCRLRRITFCWKNHVQILV